MFNKYLNWKCQTFLILLGLSFTIAACKANNKETANQIEDTLNSSDWFGTKQKPYSGPEIPRLTWGARTLGMAMSGSGQ